MKDLKYPLSIVVILTTITLTSLLPLKAAITHNHKKPIRSLKKTSWKDRFRKEFIEIEKQYPDQIGLFIKDLNTGEVFSSHADESWYLASTVKVPVAIEVLRQVDAKKISLEDKLEITPDDFVDGNGPLKSMKPGTQVSIRFLIEQMIIWSDNMATDMLLRTVGVDKVNGLVKAISPEGISRITTLKDVRRHIYGNLHSRAFELSGQDFIALRRVPNPAAKLAKFADLLQVDQEQMNLKNIHEAYEAYYSKSLNSGSPQSYSKILEALWEGKILSPSSRQILVQTMVKTQTGKKRIKAGLPHPWVFAHKTGTQYERIADVGYIFNPKNAHRKPIIVVSFVKNISDPKTSARILEKVAKIISNSGVL